MNRDEFFNRLSEKLSASGLAYVQNAYWLVKEAHRKQHRRLSGERYFEHVRRVAWSAAVDFGYCDEETVALGLLHDVVEDTFTPPSVIVNLFGARMYSWVAKLSKEHPSFDPVTGTMIGRSKIADAIYYETINRSHITVRIIKGCDRIDNLGDFAQWVEPRKTKYIVETNTHILPIIQTTDERIATEITRRLKQ